MAGVYLYKYITYQVHLDVMIDMGDDSAEAVRLVYPYSTPYVHVALIASDACAPSF
jgi:hypothetical protein